MREVPDDEHPEFIRRLREQARRDAEELVPRPGFPVFGLAAPSLTPAWVSETMKTNAEWTLIALTYGLPEDVPAGPYATVTTLALPDDADPPAFTVGMPTGRHGTGVEGELRFAVERQQDRVAQWADASPADDAHAEPVVAVPETLPDGEVLVVRQGNVWAARLLPAGTRVAVTVVGRGVPPQSVRLEPVPSLRPLIEARHAEITRNIMRNRAKTRPPQPVPDLPPAEGVAALRALADFTLATNPAGRHPRRSHPSPPANSRRSSTTSRAGEISGTKEMTKLRSEGPPPMTPAEAAVSVVSAPKLAESQPPLAAISRRAWLRTRR